MGVMKPSLLALLVVLAASPLNATEWHVLGPRALGMGGNGVALPQGAQSAYWNPATLGLADNPSGVQIPVGAHLGVTGTMIRGANDVNQLNSDCRAGSANCTPGNINEALNNMNDQANGVRGDVGVGAGFKKGRMSLFANNFMYAGVKPQVDLANNTQATIANNTSSLRVRALNVTELGVAYGRELSFAPGLNVGGAAKLMIGRTAYKSVSVVAEDPGSGIGDVSKNVKQSVQPGLDLGVLYDFSRLSDRVIWKPRLGLTARNVNNPRFTNTDAAIAAGQSRKYSVQGGLRMGLAVSPLPFWNIAADADLTNNLTSVDGVKQRNIGVGTEFNVFNRPWLNIPLRAGLSKNVAHPGSRTAVAFGAGFNFLHVNLDVGVLTSPSSERLQTQGKEERIPSDVAVSAQFAVQFGGASSVAASEKADRQYAK